MENFSSCSTNLTTPIFMLHGLGSHPISFLPMSLYLQCIGGWTNIHRITYPVDNISFEESLNEVDRLLLIITTKDTPIILIGQSMGGVIANSLHLKEWKIKFAIYIGSPLRGASFLNQLEVYLPSCVWNWMYKSSYGFLQTKETELAPPHDYHTISTAWPFLEFDGCVYVNETMFTQDKHTHLRIGDHRTIFANPRLWWTVSNLLKDSLSKLD
jgi:pimeloyl-ACP methyl ester carboxylesterase